MEDKGILSIVLRLVQGVINSTSAEILNRDTGWQRKLLIVCIAALSVFLIQPASAEPLFLEVVEISHRIQLEPHLDTVTAINELIKLYKAWGKSEKAEEWREKLLQTEAIEQ